MPEISAIVVRNAKRGISTIDSIGDSTRNCIQTTTRKARRSPGGMPEISAIVAGNAKRGISTIDSIGDSTQD